jgi:hypothetical protein
VRPSVLVDSRVVIPTVPILMSILVCCLSAVKSVAHADTLSKNLPELLCKRCPRPSCVEILKRQTETFYPHSPGILQKIPDIDIPRIGPPPNQPAFVLRGDQHVKSVCCG